MNLASFESGKCDNILEFMRECDEAFTNRDWGLYDGLVDNLVEMLKEKRHISESVEKELDALKQKVVDWGTVQLTEVTTFSEYQTVLKRIRVIVNDSKRLWEIMHHLEDTRLRVTMAEAHVLGQAFFKSSDLFECGFPGFAKNPLCEMTRISNDEALVDVFYAVTGFILATGVEHDYVAHVPAFSEFVFKLLSTFIQLPDFDAQRFVWLVEMIRQHFHLEDRELMSITEKAIDIYVNSTVKKSSWTQLCKMCTLSTSPFLKDMRKVKHQIDVLTQAVISEQEMFMRKYIFCSFVSCDWGLREDVVVTENFRMWALYVGNVAARLSERPETPYCILSRLLDDSVYLFDGYYGRVQPIRGKAVVLRKDIFGIVNLVVQLYPGEIPDRTLRHMWYLLFVAAVSGAKDSDIQNCKPVQKEDSRDPFLGLEFSTSDFCDYQLALNKFAKKFENEF
jgi:hypothetical protein